MKPLNKTANDLFQHLRTRFSPITIGDENAEVTTDPMEARFFSFVYEENGETRGPVSISIIDNRSLKVYFSHDMVESISNSNDWYKLLKELRFFAKQNLMAFDARDIQKDQLDTRDFNFIKQNDGPYKETDVEITESAMYGSKRKSMQKFENATLVVYHKKTVDEEKRGARSRHIDSIFIESNHERFRFPINYLNGARSMAVHVSEGGTPYDAIGQHIINTVTEMQNLAKFARMTKRHAMEDSEAETIRNSVVETYHAIKKDIMRMQNVNNYRTFAETFEPTDASGEADVSSLQEKFTRKVWNEQMTDLLPSVQRALEAKVNEARDTHCSDKCCGSDVKAEDCTCSPDCPHCNCNAVNEASIGAPDYNPAAGKWASNMDYGMFSDAGNEEVEEIVQAACDTVKSGENDVMAAIDGAMQMLTMLADDTPHEEAEDTDVRDRVAREIQSRCDSMNEAEVDENAFNQAAAAAARAGKPEFEFGGKKYKTKMDKDTAHKLDEASPSVEKTIKDPNFVLILKKDDAADAMLRRTQFKRADGLLSFIMSDIASRMIGDGADAVANFASDMSINISDEGSVFGTEITPEYKRDKQLAMMLAKRYLDDIKKMATDPEHAAAVRKDPKDVYGAKKKRSGGTHESVEEAFEAWAEEIFEATVGTVGTVGTTGAKTNPQVVKALSGGDANKAREIKRVSDKLARGQKLTPAEMPVAGEIAKNVMTTKKPTAAMQALAQDEYSDLNDDEDLVLEKTLKVKAKPDFPDLDGDGDTKEPMKKAIKDKEMKKQKHNEDEVSEDDDDMDLVRESLALLKKFAGI